MQFSECSFLSSNLCILFCNQSSAPRALSFLSYPAFLHALSINVIISFTFPFNKPQAKGGEGGVYSAVLACFQTLTLPQTIERKIALRMIRKRLPVWFGHFLFSLSGWKRKWNENVDDDGEDGAKNDEKTVSSLNWPQPFPQLGLQHFTPPSKIGQQYKTHVIDRDDEKLFSVQYGAPLQHNAFSNLICLDIFENRLSS